MGQPNDVLNYYLQRNDRIAAICNYCVGELLFTPEKINPVDGFYSMKNTKNKMTHIQRDILRQVEINGKKLLIGIENQNDINLIFPFRQMEMDCLEIRRQIEELQAYNKDKPRTDDFMYHYNKEDKILPIMDFVLYWGEEHWDKPQTLSDMQDLSELPDKVIAFLSAYRINIVHMREIPDEELDKMDSDIGCVIGVIKHSGNLHKLKSYMEKRKEKFMFFAKSAVDVIDVCVGMHALRELIKFQKNEEKEEVGNMCKAIDDLIEISTAKGRAEAVIELLERYGTVPQETVNKIIEESNFDNLKHWLFLAASVKSVEEFHAAM